MDESTLQFEMGRRRWVPRRDSVGFEAIAGGELVEFLITSEALAMMLNPDRAHLDAEMAIETFDEFEADIHRIAQRAYRMKRGGDRPIMILVEDVEV